MAANPVAGGWQAGGGCYAQAKSRRRRRDEQGPAHSMPPPPQAFRAASDCNVTIDGEALDYSLCYDAGTKTSPVKLYATLEEMEGGAAVASVALRAKSSGWLGLAIGSEMLNSNAVFAVRCSSCRTGEGWGLPLVLPLFVGVSSSDGLQGVPLDWACRCTAACGHAGCRPPGPATYHSLLGGLVL